MATEPWFGFDAPQPYQGGDPAYFAAEDLGWPLLLEANWLAIREEFELRFGDGRSLDVFFDEAMIARHGTWKTHSLYVHGLRYHRNLRSFPKTDAILRQIPGLVSASFSFLEPGGDILPHHGDSNMIVRGHLPLLVPAGLPDCGMEVDGQQRPWEVGRMLLFCDAYEHRAWNHSQKPRLIMIIDVMKQEHQDETLAVCSRVLGALLIFRTEAALRQRLPAAGIERLPSLARKTLHRAFSGAWRAYLPIQKRISRLPPR